MILGLYTAASGMIAQLKKEDLVANNLSNLNTPGFKSSQVSQEAFSNILMERLGENPATVGAVGTGTVLGQTTVDLSQGALQQTGEPLDFALEGPGFFAVKAAGGTEYTRAGNFTLDGNGDLVTQAGYQVLGTNGTPLVIGTNADLTGTGSVQVGTDGTVTVNGTVVGQLQVDNFANPGSLVIGPDGYFQAGSKAGSPTQATAASGALSGTGTSGTQTSATQVAQGFLEASNTDQLKESVNMLTEFRAYEACQKAIVSENLTMDWAAGQVGKV